MTNKQPASGNGGGLPDAGGRPSPLRALYKEWQALKDDYDTSPIGRDEATLDKLFDQILKIERQAADFVPKTTEDLAFKVVFADDDGNMTMNRQQEALAECCYALTGIEPRQARAA